MKERLGFFSFGASSFFRSVSHTLAHTHTYTYLHSFCYDIGHVVYNIRSFNICFYLKLSSNIAEHRQLSFIHSFIFHMCGWLWKGKHFSIMLTCLASNTLYAFSWLRLRISFGPLYRSRKRNEQNWRKKGISEIFLLFCLIWFVLCVCVWMCTCGWSSDCFGFGHNTERYSFKSFRWNRHTT